ncbi:MAG TPA: methylmalonyl-CoA mutase family protein, partial [Candidatus Limnocylindria bacterium]|nr:methylmalonyl-CoA mutase family protein [Candidatus Limnocylindria bacterium]
MKSRPSVTPSGIPVKSVYGAGDLAGFDPASQLGEPGAFPYARGLHPEGYRSRLW